MARKQTKSEKFVRMFIFWMGKLNFHKPINTIKNNRLDCPVAIDAWGSSKTIRLLYHTRRLGQVPNVYFYNYLFHELGHLVNKLPYKTYAERVISEREAEKFSIRMLKKHYPIDYKRMIKRMVQKKSLIRLKKEEPLYYKAYIQIKEYAQLVRKDI